MKMTRVFDTGSIHRLVPVNPVWPKEPSGNSLPRGLLKVESMSQPRPRRSKTVAMVCGAVMILTVSGFKMLEPPARIMRAYFARSPAVVKSPA